MTPSGSNKKIANRLVALSSAAVLSVYAAGYVRTRPAADRFALRAAEGRPGEHRPAPQPPPADTALGTPDSVPLPAEPVHSDLNHEPAATPKHAISAQPEPSATAVPSAVHESAPTDPVDLPILTTPISAPVLTASVAPAPLPLAEPKMVIAPSAPPQAPAPKWKDGIYLGWGTSRHGDIQASVQIENGRIASATIAQCRTRYSCSVIEQLPPQVAQRQSPDVDTVSRATQSADAFYYAVVEALSKAK